MESDFYALLKVPPTATLDEIKRSYYELAKLHHPDKNQPGSLNFTLLQEAWDTLKDPERRRRYNEQYMRLQHLEGVSRVAAEVDLDEMEFEASTASFSAPCRCGGLYVISEEQMESGIDLVYCNGCTLLIHVLYQQADTEQV